MPESERPGTLFLGCEAELISVGSLAGDPESMCLELFVGDEDELLISLLPHEIGSNSMSSAVMRATNLAGQRRICGFIVLLRAFFLIKGGLGQMPSPPLYAI